MLGLDARDLCGAEFFAPIARLAAAEEIAAGVRTWCLAEAFLPLLIAQLLEIRKGHRARNRSIGSLTVCKRQHVPQRAGGIGLHVLIADEMDRNVRLVEPARDVAAPARQLLAKLIILFACAYTKPGCLVVHERDCVIDTALTVI